MWLPQNACWKLASLFCNTASVSLHVISCFCLCTVNSSIVFQCVGAPTIIPSPWAFRLSLNENHFKGKIFSSPSQGWDRRSFQSLCLEIVTTQTNGYFPSNDKNSRTMHLSCFHHWSNGQLCGWVLGGSWKANRHGCPDCHLFLLFFSPLWFSKPMPGPGPTTTRLIH